jgi:hypothetical protein
MKTIIILFLCALPFAAHTQTTAKAFDTRLSAMYDADYLQRLQQLQPAQLERLNFYLDHSYSIESMPQGKTAVELPVADWNAEGFNILAFERDNKVQRQKTQPVYFRLRNTDKILVLLAEDEFVKQFNAATGRVYSK